MEQNEAFTHPPRLRYILGVAIGILLIGVVFYHRVENLSWVDSLYFCVITLTTIGYGDIVPHTTAGKLFTVGYVLIGITLLAAVLNYLIRRTLIHRAIMHQKRKDHEK
jgi:voltage-gated potassium channel